MSRKFYLSETLYYFTVNTPCTIRNLFNPQEKKTF